MDYVKLGLKLELKEKGKKANFIKTNRKLYSISLIF